MQLQWATLQLPSRHLEEAYQASRAPFLLWLDTWHLILNLIYCAIWLAVEAIWAGFSHADAKQQSSCHSVLLPVLQAYITTCSSRTWSVGITASVAILSVLALLALCLRPGFYGQHRLQIITALWLLCLGQQISLHLAQCSLQFPGLSCQYVVAANILSSAAFVLWQLPISLAVLYFGAHCAVRSLFMSAARPTAGAASQLSILQIVAHCVAPVLASYWLEKRSRTQFLRLQGRAAAGVHLADEKAIEREHAEGPETPDHLREISYRPPCVRRHLTSEVVASRASAGVAGPSSTSTASSAAAARGGGSGSHAAAAAGQAAAAVQAPGQGAAAAAALLAYQSPFRRRTVTIKVQAPEVGSDSIDPAVRLAAAVQAAIAAMPGGQSAAVASHVCIPGCLLFLGRVLLIGKQDEQQDLQQPPAVPQDGVWAVQLASSTSGGDGSSRSAGLRLGSPPVTPCAAASTGSLVYPTMNDLEAAARDGTFQTGVQKMLQERAAACPASHVVATWGSRLQLALWQQEHGVRQSWWSRRQQTATAGSSNSGRSLHIRAVLSQGSRVLLDMQHLLAAQQPTAAAAAAAAAPGRQFWSLGIDLPASGSGSNGSSSVANSSTGAAAGCGAGSNTGAGVRGVLSLYILSAESASTGGACAPLGDVTLLLLPHEAAAELTGLVKQHQFTQQQLQPLMMDMGVALEAESMLAGGNSTTATAAAASTPGAEGSSLADEVTPDYLVAAAEAADRVTQFLESTGLASCAEIVALCQQQLLTACASQATSRKP